MKNTVLFPGYSLISVNTGLNSNLMWYASQYMVMWTLLCYICLDVNTF